MCTYRPYRFAITCLLCFILLMACQHELHFPEESPVAAELPVTGIACADCMGRDSIAFNRWSFYADNKFYCGKTDTAIIISLTRDAFTFFGPSSCSLDSGLVMTVYLDPPGLSRDTTNYEVKKVSFFYYDHNGVQNIFISKGSRDIIMQIDSYNHVTKIATGHFEGYGYKPSGSTAVVTKGKFQVKL